MVHAEGKLLGRHAFEYAWAEKLSGTFPFWSPRTQHQREPSIAKSSCRLRSSGSRGQWWWAKWWRTTPARARRPPAKTGLC